MKIRDVDEDPSDSDNDSDDALLAEIHGLSGACLYSSIKNSAPKDGTAARTPAAGGGSSFNAAASDSEESDDDFEFLRSVKQKYGPGADGGPSSPKPIAALPPLNYDSDDDSDFELLRTIQTRFGRCSEARTDGESDAVPGTSKSNTPVDENLGTGGGGRLDGEDEGVDVDSGINEDIPIDDVPGTSNSNTPVDENLGTGGGARLDGEDEGGDVDSGINEDIPVDDDEKQVESSQHSELPKAVLVLIDAIRKNRSAQKLVRNKMLAVEAKMGKIKEVIKRVKIIWEFDLRRRRKMERQKRGDRLRLISTPAGDKKGPGAFKLGPQENARVANYRFAFSLYPQWIPKEKWTKEDRNKLRKGVTQQVQKCLLLKSMDRINESEGSDCASRVDGVISKIKKVEVTPETIKSFLPKIDWNELASTYLPRRTGQECQARWMNHENPLINFGEWSAMEDKQLLITLQRKGYNWDDLVESLGTNRTPYQCLARYQRSLNPSLIKREWSSAEDAELTAAVETYGESNWTVVASVMDGRTGPQCSNRWLKTLLPSKQRKGRWNAEEDERLKIAVMLMGKCWYKIAEFVPGRTQARCRDRWMNCLDPSLKFTRWTKKEDKLLIKAVEEHGKSWAKVAMCVAPRTDCQCRTRWLNLFKDEGIKYRAERKLTKTVLPANFVDREPNRPALKAIDFRTLSPEDNTTAEKKVRKKKSRKARDVAVSDPPKKGRPRGRRGRRKAAESSQPPVLDQCESSGTSTKKKRVKGNAKNPVKRIQRKKKRKASGDQCESLETSIKNKRVKRDSKIPVKRSQRIRKRRANETASEGRDTELEGQGSCILDGDEEAESSTRSDVTMKSKSTVTQAEESDNEPLVSLMRRKCTSKQRKRRKLKPAKSEDWGDDMPLMTLFKRAVKARKQMK